MNIISAFVPVNVTSSFNSMMVPEELARRLLAWYQPESRAMPWRGSRDPYEVWISEIMLQQTRVETVRAYFVRFLERFPTIHALAQAPLEDVLKVWEGLGYYSRARNLHKAACVVESAGGILPTDVAGLSALPGIGPYTAASISSICVGTPVPVVDGNVIRLFSRFLACSEDFRKTENRAALSAWLRPAIEVSGCPGDFNQAMMDLGATCCTPRSPDCERCPLKSGCVAFREEQVNVYPWKPPKKPLPERQQSAFIILGEKGTVLLRQRPQEGLLGGLWELPCADEAIGLQGRPTVPDGFSPEGWRSTGTLTHIFTHFRLVWRIFATECAMPSLSSYSFRHPNHVPLTTLSRRALSLVEKMKK